MVDGLRTFRQNAKGRNEGLLIILTGLDWMLQKASFLARRQLMKFCACTPLANS
jgi:hypothetical protein